MQYIRRELNLKRDSFRDDRWGAFHTRTFMGPASSAGASSRSCSSARSAAERGRAPDACAPGGDRRARPSAVSCASCAAASRTRRRSRARSTGADVVIQLATGGGDTWEKVERSMVHGSRDAAEAALAARRAALRVRLVDRRAVHRPRLRRARDRGLDRDRSAARGCARSTRAARSRRSRRCSSSHATRGLPLAIVRPGVVRRRGHADAALGPRPVDARQPLHRLGPRRERAAARLGRRRRRRARAARRVTRGRTSTARRSTCARACRSRRARSSRSSRARRGRDLHFHPRSLALSQAMEIGKWVVKKAGRRAGVEFPSWRDLKSRALDVAVHVATSRATCSAGSRSRSARRSSRRRCTCMRRRAAIVSERHPTHAALASRRSSTPSSFAQRSKYARSIESRFTLSTPVTSRHCRSEISSPWRYQASFCRTMSSGLATSMTSSS